MKQKPFNCDICDKGFNKKYNQKIHMENIFQCGLCHSNFPHMKHLKSHVNNVHAGKVIYYRVLSSV